MFNPISTYRVQLHKGFTFKDLKQLIPYLYQLGVKTIYASPIMQATPGSTHGYDGVNTSFINPEIGTELELKEIITVLKQNRIGWLQDIVPNHMAVHEQNAWLQDVLQRGKESEYADFFDIKWEDPSFEGKLIAVDDKINYRRFFTVNELICLNMQNEKVFNVYHHYLQKLIAEEMLQGLRVDHIDGLSDPTDYLKRLRKLAGDESYIVVEKIVQQKEEMPDYWPVQGNTGYDFLSMVNNLFTDAFSKNRLTSFYEALIGNNRKADEQIIDKKAFILYHHMPGELNNLTQLYFSLGLGKKDEEREIVKKDIADYLISCPVYRYYDENIPLMKRDEGKEGSEVKTFYTRCMQFTGPLMAKGVEDTLMYTYNRFIGHNEVGDSPENFGLSCEDFHYAMQERQRHWSLSLNASSTHDTKRGEDARARLNVLTNMPDEWIAICKEWFIINEDIKTQGWPDVNDEYFIYQSLIGNYPMPDEEDADFKDRFLAYLIKAFREAKRITNWISPNEDYEKAVGYFISDLLNKERPFWNDFILFHKRVVDLGLVNSLSQVALKLTCPGVPDTYQGCELWDFSFVDPDNRRPVDYSIRHQWLKEIQQINIQQLWNDRYSGKIKLWLTSKLLQERADHDELFNKGEYIPLKVTGKYSKYIIAYARHYLKNWYVVVVPLQLTNLPKKGNGQIDWEDTCILLPGDALRQWYSVLDDRTIQQKDCLLLSEITDILPIVLLRSYAWNSI